MIMGINEPPIYSCLNKRDGVAKGVLLTLEMLRDGWTERSIHDYFDVLGCDFFYSSIVIEAIDKLHGYEHEIS